MFQYKPLDPVSTLTLWLHRTCVYIDIWVRVALQMLRLRLHFARGMRMPPSKKASTVHFFSTHISSINVRRIMLGFFSFSRSEDIYVYHVSMTFMYGMTRMVWHIMLFTLKEQICSSCPVLSRHPCFMVTQGCRQKRFQMGRSDESYGKCV